MVLVENPPSPSASALEAGTPHRSCCESIGWFGRKVIDFTTEKIIKYRQVILYVAIAFSAAAVVAAFFTKVVLIIFLTVGSALLFWLSAWAFRIREARISQDMGQENARLLKAVQEGEETLGREQENLKELQSKNEQLSTLNIEQAQEIEKLHQSKAEYEKRVEELSTLNDQLRAEQQKIIGIENRLKGLFPAYFA